MLVRTCCDKVHVGGLWSTHRTRGDVSVTFSGEPSGAAFWNGLPSYWQ